MGHEAHPAFDLGLDRGALDLDAADLGDDATLAEFFDAVEDGLDDVSLVGGAVALGEAVGDASDFEDGADGAASDDARARSGWDQGGILPAQANRAAKICP